MLHIKYRKYLSISLLGLILIIAVLIVGSGMAQTTTIPASTAINLALSYSKDGGKVGGLVDPPTKMFGKLMTYVEAVYIFGQPINPGDAIAKMANNPVWLVVLQGKIVEHVPPAPDIPEKDVMNTQMALIIDGNSGKVVERILISPQTTLSVASLPVLISPSGAVPPPPTKGPIFTEVPLPTATPIP
jgi:hypothetical protein